MLLAGCAVLTESGWSFHWQTFLALTLFRFNLHGKATPLFAFAAISVRVSLFAPADCCWYRFSLLRLTMGAFVQNFVIKTFIFAVMWSIFALYLEETAASAWRSFWQGMFPVLNILLYGSQVYAVRTNVT